MRLDTMVWRVNGPSLHCKPAFCGRAAPHSNPHSKH